jgi:hypothetical protein
MGAALTTDAVIGEAVTGGIEDNVLPDTARRDAMAHAANNTSGRGSENGATKVDLR